MKIVIEIEYKPCDENETFERTKEIVIGNIENCLGNVISVKEAKERFNALNNWRMTGN